MTEHVGQRLRSWVGCQARRAGRPDTLVRGLRAAAILVLMQISGSMGAGAATEATEPTLESMHALAAEGAPEAMLYLGNYYEQLDTDASAARESIYWYGRAMIQGRASAMRRLGSMLLTRPGFSDVERDEGLVLLNMAWLLGDERARRDLDLLPDIMSIDPRALDDARRGAIARFEQGVLWNDRAFPQIRMALTAGEAAFAEERAAKLRDRFTEGTWDSEKRLVRWQASRARAAADDAERWERRRRAYEARIGKKNALRMRRNARVARRKALAQRSEGSTRAYFDRIAARREAARMRTSRVTASELEALEARVRAMLERVNYHRNPKAAISLDPRSLPLRPPG